LSSPKEEMPERLSLSPAKHEVELVLEQVDSESGTIEVRFSFDYGKDKTTVFMRPSDAIAISQKLNEFAGYAIRQGCEP
jgi:hypothetical protein